MSLQIASQLTQRHQILHGEKAPQCQRRIQAGRGVTFAQDKPVPILPMGIFRIHAQFLEIQIGEHVRSRQTAAGMSAFGRVDALNYAHTHFAGHDLQLLFFLGCHSILLEIYKCGNICSHTKIGTLYILRPTFVKQQTGLKCGLSSPFEKSKKIFDRVQQNARLNRVVYRIRRGIGGRSGSGRSGLISSLPG